MEGFRYRLFQNGIDPLRSLNDLETNHHNTIIILVGPASLENYLPHVRRAVEMGASILIASDRSSRNSLFPYGVQITGESASSLNPDDCYRRWASYPYVRPFQSPLLQDRESAHAIFAEFKDRGADAIATNDPSILRIVNLRTARPPVALAGYADSTDILERDFDPRRDLFAAAGTLGDGRFLVLADHSVFVNRMILKDDNANLAFTENCITWLKGDENRTRCLFVEDGEIKTDFELAIPDSNDSNLQKYLKMMLLAERHGDKIVADLEARDFFNRLVLMRFSVREIVRLILIALTLMLLFIGFVRLVKSRTKPDPARAMITPELAAMIPRGSAIQQRFDSQLDTENVYENARQLVRDHLVVLDAEPDKQGRAPIVEVRDGYRDESSLRKRIARLWQIGFGAQPITIKPEGWTKLTTDLKGILEQADEGWWKFVATR